MSTRVFLDVTPRAPVDPDGDPAPVPADLAALLSAAGQPVTHAWSRHGDGPWRFRFRLGGADRAAIGRALEVGARQLGYEADVSVHR